MRKAVFPGTFDPVTLGHLDLIDRGRKLFDELVVLVARNPGKSPILTTEERTKLLRRLVADWRGVSVDTHEGLLVDYLRRKDVGFILRGIRTVSDFEYELQMASTNRALSSGTETVFLPPSQEHALVSSKLVREAAALGADVSRFVPPEAWRVLRRRVRPDRRRS